MTSGTLMAFSFFKNANPFFSIWNIPGNFSTEFILQKNFAVGHSIRNVSLMEPPPTETTRPPVCDMCVRIHPWSCLSIQGSNNNLIPVVCYLNNPIMARLGGSIVTKQKEQVWACVLFKRIRLDIKRMEIQI